MITMTVKQNMTLNFIKNYIEKEKIAPSMREIAEEFGVTIKAIHDRLSALRKKRFIDWQTNRPRTIKILEKNNAIQEKG